MPKYRDMAKRVHKVMGQRGFEPETLERLVGELATQPEEAEKILNRDFAEPTKAEVRRLHMGIVNNGEWSPKEYPVEVFGVPMFGGPCLHQETTDLPNEVVASLTEAARDHGVVAPGETVAIAPQAVSVQTLEKMGVMSYRSLVARLADRAEGRASATLPTLSEEAAPEPRGMSLILGIRGRHPTTPAFDSTDQPAALQAWGQEAQALLADWFPDPDERILGEWADAAPRVIYEARKIDRLIELRIKLENTPPYPAARIEASVAQDQEGRWDNGAVDFHDDQGRHRLRMVWPIYPEEMASPLAAITDFLANQQSYAVTDSSDGDSPAITAANQEPTPAP